MDSNAILREVHELYTMSDRLDSIGGMLSSNMLLLNLILLID